MSELHVEVWHDGKLIARFAEPDDARVFCALKPYWWQHQFKDGRAVRDADRNMIPRYEIKTPGYEVVPQAGHAKSILAKLEANDRAMVDYHGGDPDATYP